MEDIRIVAIGGGTGLSMLLKGLKKYTHNVTAVVTVADDGGSSGRLREDLGMCAPGDVRNCINALAKSEMRDILNYRFTDGALKGHSFGNIWLAALDGMSDSFSAAVEIMNRQLNVDGEVLPVTNESVALTAQLEDGSVICGESNIGHRRVRSSAIEKIVISPKIPKPAEKVLERLSAADIIIMGPGSLYTSIIPNLLVDGVVDEIKNSGAMTVYVSNVMTQPGETDGYGAWRHMAAIDKHSYEGICRYIIANDAPIAEEVLGRYELEGGRPVELFDEEFKSGKTEMITEGLLAEGSEYVKHDCDKIARVIMDLYRNK